MNKNNPVGMTPEPHVMTPVAVKSEYMTCSKLFFLLGAAMFGSMAIMGVGIGQVYENAAVFSNVYHAQQVLKSCDSIGFMMHGLAGERGSTIVYINSGYERVYLEELKRARSATDDTLRLVGGDYVPSLVGSEYTSEQMALDLRGLREQVGGLSAQATEDENYAERARIYLGKYNGIIGEVMDVIGFSMDSLLKLNHWQQFMDYYIFTIGKDYEGLERAMGSSIISDQAHVTINELNTFFRMESGSRRTYDLVKLIDESTALFFKNIDAKKSSEFVHAYQERFSQMLDPENSYKFEAIDAQRFFNNMSSVLTDRLHAYNQLLDKIHTGLDEKQALTENAIMTYSIVCGAGFVWMLIQVLFVFLSIFSSAKYGMQLEKLQADKAEKAEVKGRSGKKGRITITPPADQQQPHWSKKKQKGRGSRNSQMAPPAAE